MRPPSKTPTKLASARVESLAMPRYWRFRRQGARTEFWSAIFALDAALPAISRALPKVIQFAANFTATGDIVPLPFESVIFTGPPGALVFDNITFGALVIPEPSSKSLLLITKLTRHLTLGIVQLSFGRRDKLLRRVARIIRPTSSGNRRPLVSRHPTAHPNSLSWHSARVDSQLASY